MPLALPDGEKAYRQEPVTWTRASLPLHFTLEPYEQIGMDVPERVPWNLNEIRMSNHHALLYRFSVPDKRWTVAPD